MKKDELEDLIQKLNTQMKIIENSRDTFEDIKYLQQKDVRDESEKFILGHVQWIFISKLLWSYLILELFKIHSKKGNDKFRIKAILNFLNEKYENLPFKKSLNKAALIDLIEEIDSQNFKVHFEKLTYIRDKYVAHLDRGQNVITIENADIDYFLKINDRFFKEVIYPIVINDNIFISGYPSSIKDMILNFSKHKAVYDKLQNVIMNPKERENLKPETLNDLLKILQKKNFITEGID
jgi:hypothetical protein